MLLKYNPALPLPDEKSGRFDNETIGEARNIDSIKFLMWKIYYNDGWLLESLVIPMIGYLSCFLIEGKNPNRANIHRYVSYGGHVPLIAIYLYGLEQEYVIDYANMFYMNRTTGSYCPAIWEISRTNYTEERAEFLKIYNLNSVVIDYFPMGSNGRRSNSPYRAFFETPYNNAVLPEDYLPYICNQYSIAIGTMYRIMLKYLPTMRSKIFGNN